jgi:acetoin utilization deacetylase AcuC-like enzyme
MKAFYCDHFALPLPQGHRFPITKYARLRESIALDGRADAITLQVPHAATDDELERAHRHEYVWRVVTGGLSEAETRRIGFPWSPELVERSRRSAGGTIAACRAALEEGVSVNLAGGTHHAFVDRGEGFCMFNDSAVAAKAMQAEGRVTSVAVVDCDVHQGNGTAAIFAGDPTVFTFSIHGANNFPFRKARSDLDVELPDGSGDATYLEALGWGLQQVLEAGRPELVIYVSGADPFHGDMLGRLGLSKAGLAERDRRVVETFAGNGSALAVVMAGGYAADVEDTVAIHRQTVREAADAWCRLTGAAVSRQVP